VSEISSPPSHLCVHDQLLTLEAADLVDETLPISATVTPTLSPVPAATEESRKRSIPRWMARAKAGAVTALEPEPAV
jgi:hypothetical protein